MLGWVVAVIPSKCVRKTDTQSRCSTSGCLDVSPSCVAQPGRRQRRCLRWGLSGAAQFLCFGACSVWGVATATVIVVIADAASLYHHSGKYRVDWATPSSVEYEMPDKLKSVSQSSGSLGSTAVKLFCLTLNSAGLRDLQHVAPAHMQPHLWSCTFSWFRRLRRQS